MRKPARGAGRFQEPLGGRGIRLGRPPRWGAPFGAIIVSSDLGEAVDPDEIHLSYPPVIHQAEVIDTFDLKNR